MANPTTFTNCASNNGLSNNSQSYIIMLAAASKNDIGLGSYELPSSA
eukprot:CAMPEP_0202031068 /NCGR_PEP_ID=MMETSP0905-20130828/64826_1 /ASSEMBLY_ACC=CAM_ASM_000554 /TAXON_ID=420261 /ORGANISM="Thalassiosira antarctica, Strain CCMP982" /LENGTH=46 /DNA_ID= /DNA_START= /DNA_END= /DNA_ORIENTATION=